MNNRPKLSLCMIVRDNEGTIEPCLSSIRPWVDEMIVVDTGSRDCTPDIARRLGAKVSHFAWPDCFSTARNESLRLATGEWLFWMDSDDVIDERNGRALRELAYATHPSHIAAYVMQVHCPDVRDKDDLHIVDHVKLFRNHSAIRFEHRIHEQVLMPIRRLGAEIGMTDIFVVHANSDQTPEGRHRKTERDLRLLHLDLQDYPDHPFVLFNFGMTHNYLGQHAEAISWLERCITASTGESHVCKAYAILVHSLTEVGRHEDAMAACRYALELFAKDAELLFRQGLLLHHQGRLGEAIQAYRGVLSNGAERHLRSRCESITGYKARNNLAIVYDEGKAYGMAELQWRTILEEKPDYRPAWKALGHVLMNQGRRETASIVAERMLQTASMRADGLSLQAELAMNSGDKTGALKLFDQAIEEFPDDIDPPQSRCRVLFERGDWDEAYNALLALIQRQPKDGSAWHNLGLVEMHRNHLAESAAAFQRSLEIRPDSHETRRLFDEVLTALRQRVSSDGINAIQELPACHSRRDHDKEAGVYFCVHPKVRAAGNLVTPTVCRMCTRWQEPPPAAFRPYLAIVHNGPCAYLGEQTGLRDCPSCRGDVKVKVYSCSHPAHQSTTLAECLHCLDYQLEKLQGYKSV